MANTRQVAAYVLQQDEQLREWFEREHRFTIEKVKNGALEDYQDLIGVVIRDGVNQQVISQAQADGADDL